MLLADSIGRKSVVSPLPHALGIGAGEHLDDLVDAKIKMAVLPDPVDARETLLGRHGPIVGFARSEAIIAAAAILFGESFAEILQQFAPAANGALGVVDHLLQLLAGDLPLPQRLFAD